MDKETVTELRTDITQVEAGAREAQNAFSAGDYIAGAGACVMTIVLIVAIVYKWLQKRRVASVNAAALKATEERSDNAT